MALAPMGLISNGALGARHLEFGRLTSAALLALVLAGCASTQNGRAPVEERGTSSRSSNGSNGATSNGSADSSRPPPGAENAGKPGYFSVRPGDTLIRIGLETGQNWKDLMKWNNLENPNLIEVGQVLRVVPPGADPSAVTTRAVTTAKVEARPLDAPKPAAGAASAPAASAPVAAAPASTASGASPAPAPGARGDDELNWLWPASGTVIATFDEVRSKGLAIAGKAGDPVVAAADGRVVYAGSGLRGYGNLVILKHNNTYLTAYAHNQTLLVKEEQTVRRGQKIAEMGSTDAERVQLHFEIRKQGKPIDPGKLLPAR